MVQFLNAAENGSMTLVVYDEVIESAVYISMQTEKKRIPTH